MNEGSPEYLAVGHLTRDRQPDGHYRWGGTALYAAATAAAMGCRAAILTRTTPIDPLPTPPGVEIVSLPTATTTTFYNRYTPSGDRTQRLEAIAAPLTADELPSTWRQPKILHIAPVIGECDSSWLHLRVTFVGLTPQGFLRHADAQGYIHPTPWPTAEHFLRHSDAVVLSIEDLGGDRRQAERWATLTPLLVLTEGARGGTYFHHGTERRYTTPTARSLDPTGAGDIFAAALFVALRKGQAVETAIALAACVAAASVEAEGLSAVPNPATLHRCGWR